MTDFSFVPYGEHSHSLLHRPVLDAVGSNDRYLLLESNIHTEAVCVKTKDFKTLLQMVRQIIAGHQKASFVCEMKFKIFMTALDCIPKRDFVVAVNGELRCCPCICTDYSEVRV